MTIIGLTGGIGAGKSEVARIFRRLGFSVINLDQLGSEILEDRSLWRRVEKICDRPVIVGGKLSKPSVQKIIFQSPKKRKALERFLHPKIWKLFLKKAKGKRQVLCEAALLMETGLFRKLSSTILVVAPLTDRIQRVQRRNGMEVALVTKIAASQWSDQKKKKHANYVLVNDGHKRHLVGQVKKLAARL